MLLFFDGVAILVPSEAEALVFRDQEETVVPLLDQGLLHLLDPATWIDHSVATGMLDLVLHIATSQELESIHSGRSLDARGILFRDLTGPRSLTRQEREASLIVWEEMQRRGLASGFGPDETMLVDTDKWQLILAFLANALTPAGRRAGWDLQPATDEMGLSHALRHLLGTGGVPSEGHVLTFDLEQISLDLSAVPIPDLLDFRHRHGAGFRAYSAQLRRFVFELSTLEGEDQRIALAHRRDELADEADRLKRLARTWWRRPAASVLVGLVGAAWSGGKGDWPASILSLLAGFAGAGSKPDMSSAYSYLFQARHVFGSEATPLRSSGHQHTGHRH